MTRRTLWLTVALAVALAPLGCAQDPGADDELPEPAGRGSADAPTPPAEPAAWPDSIVREVLAMEVEDQRVRAGVASLMQQAAPDSAAVARAVAEQQATDRTHTNRLKAIFGAHGWPAKADVGSEAATAAFLVVQHADHDLAFQKEYLAFLERELAKGEAPAQAVALLTDRTRLAEGRPQLYGTQMTIADGTVTLDPIEDEARVDERRSALGLEPLADYIAKVKQAYGIPQ